MRAARRAPDSPKRRPHSPLRTAAFVTVASPQVLGQPASGGNDIPSKWAAEVSADKTPLVAYPRPQMVRGAAPSLAQLRNEGPSGAEGSWHNLNGLWEWEPASSEEPPVGRTLASSILVPFPVESCLSGVAPNSSKAIVQRMWYAAIG